jgi:hypothetical protein
MHAGELVTIEPDDEAAWQGCIDKGWLAPVGPAPIPVPVDRPDPTRVIDETVDHEAVEADAE